MPHKMTDKDREDAARFSRIFEEYVRAIVVNTTSEHVEDAITLSKARESFFEFVNEIK